MLTICGNYHSHKALPILATLSLFLSGCGTFSDAICGPIDDRVFYRGVRMDVEAVKQGMPLMAADIPFSAIADTLFVPCLAFQELTSPRSKIYSVNEESVNAK